MWAENSGRYDINSSFKKIVQIMQVLMTLGQF